MTTTLSIESARESAAREWVWCQGWSPREGSFGRLMPPLGYPGEMEYDLAGACAGELQHPASGCKNVTTRPIFAGQVEEVAQRILAARQERHDRARPQREKWAAANAYLGRCSMGRVEIGDDLAHVRRNADGSAAVIELVNGQWIARAPRDGERIYV